MFVASLANDLATHAGVDTEGAVEDEAGVQLSELEEVVLGAVGFLKSEHIAPSEQACDLAELGRPLAGVVANVDKQARDVPRDEPETPASEEAGLGRETQGRSTRSNRSRAKTISGKISVNLSPMAFSNTR